MEIPDAAPLTAHSETLGGLDERAGVVPKHRKSIVVDGGLLVSRLGPVEKTARWGDWDTVWSDESRTVAAGWGYCLMSGDVLIPRRLMEDPPPGRFVQNVYEIEAFGETSVLVHIDPARGHRVCFMETPEGKRFTAGYTGAKAETGGRVLERKADGWYLGTTRMSL
jgi:hypothetical protein